MHARQQNNGIEYTEAEAESDAKALLYRLRQLSCREKFAEPHAKTWQHTSKCVYACTRACPDGSGQARVIATTGGTGGTTPRPLTAQCAGPGLRIVRRQKMATFQSNQS